MVAPSVEQLKTQYTDKYVAVDATRPELARFRGAVGQIKTVNMNGRALVQFLDYHLNTGWYDIDLSCLQVVDPPPKEETAKPEAKRPHDKPAGKAAPTAGDKQVKDAAAEKKKLSPIEMARMQGAGGGAKPAAAPGAKKSTSDVLAAARGGAAPAAKAAPKPAADKPAEAKPAGAAPAAKTDRSKMSVAEMLAAARGNKPEAAAAAPSAAPAASAPAVKPQAAVPAAPAPTPSPAASEGSVKRVDKTTMSVAEMIAYCRKADSK